MNPKILIVPLINKKEHGVVIQRKKFFLGLRIINKSDIPSPEFKIKDLELFSDQNQDLSADYKKEFYIGILNPNESRDIEIEEDGQIISGLVRIQAIIQASDSAVTIDTMQKNSITKKISDGLPNRFIDFLYIKSLYERKQERSTTVMICLTIMIGILALAQLALFFKQIYN